MKKRVKMEDGTYDADDITLISNQSLNKGDTINYKLYVWLSYKDDVRQNDLLNGNLSVKVGFNAVSQ